MTGRNRWCYVPDTEGKIGGPVKESFFQDPKFTAETKWTVAENGKFWGLRTQRFCCHGTRGVLEKKGFLPWLKLEGPLPEILDSEPIPCFLTHSPASKSLG